MKFESVAYGQRIPDAQGFLTWEANGENSSLPEVWQLYVGFSVNGFGKMGKREFVNAFLLTAIMCRVDALGYGLNIYDKRSRSQCGERVDSRISKHMDGIL
jgi:hypothetical protein